MEGEVFTPRAPISSSALSESAMGAHIQNLYEAHDEPIILIYEIINAALNGKLQEVQEKMDGQNITFTHIAGELQFFSKGATWKRVQQAISGERPGLNAESIISTYASRPAIMHSFLDAYHVMDSIASRDKDLMERLFQGGDVTVTSLLMHPKNPNTILYDEPTLRFAEIVAVNPDAEIDHAAYNEFISLTEQEQNNTISVGSVPILEFMENSDAKSQISELEGMLDTLIDRANLTKNSTIGELVYKLVLHDLENYDFIPKHLRSDAAKRLVLNSKKSLTNKSFRQKENWKKFQELEKDNTIVMKASAPLEQIIQKLGAYVFRTLTFVLGSDDTGSGAKLQSMVRGVEAAFQQGRVITNPAQAKRIGAALERAVPQLELFEKQIEGIVFNFNGKWYKLTGLFTAINKIRGFFAFGQNPAKIKG